MVVVARGIRKPTRSKSGEISAARKPSRSTGDVDSPPNSPPVTRSRDSRVSRAIAPPQFTDPTPSPFSMHNADHPGLILVAIHLDGTNYDDWDAAMRIALDSKRKLGFVDGSLYRPDESDPSFALWSCCNSMVKSWLLNSVSPDIYRSILRLRDASDIWNDLYSHFHMSDLPRTFNLTQEIQDLSQGSMSLMVYYTKLKTLWSSLENTEEPDEPCICGKAARLQQKAERAKIVKFLAGLNESYAIIRRQIIMKKVLPNIAEVYKILDQDDSQKGFTNVVVNPAAFQVSDTGLSNASDPTICYKDVIRSMGFLLVFSPKGKMADKSQKPRHLAAQVALVNTESDDTPSTLEDMVGGMSKDQIKKFIAMFSSHLHAQGPNNNTTVASTSQSDNIGIAFSPSTYCFVGILTIAQHALSMHLPTGPTVQISGIGTIQINKHIILKNVLFIPEFRLNLLSISSRTDDLGFKVIFDTSTCEIQDPIKVQMVGQGKRIANLYILDVGVFSISVNAVVDISLWHRRLGHASLQRLDTISESLGTTRHKNKGSDYCHVCHLAKQKKLFLPSPNNVCNETIELLHIDIWGLSL
ncbi:PREDICTED: uncharacterized protein LOC104784213 [Camelina sativa]|uniref:Uncharacterized protein LOC104784213 n=1 Tax=Camelina sativa TaxID=90675 RepID=A0ABM0YXR4_CAMSA|nr:PREDICTED: uncharacterized protein LOC104784213 [Camelina sativa]